MEDDSEGNENDWLATIKNTIPPNHLSYFNLYFNTEKTVYKPGREAEGMSKIPTWFIQPRFRKYCF